MEDLISYSALVTFCFGKKLSEGEDIFDKQGNLENGANFSAPRIMEANFILFP